MENLQTLSYNIGGHTGSEPSDRNTFLTDSASGHFNYALSHRNALPVSVCVGELVVRGGWVFRNTVGFKIVPVVSFCLSCFDVSGSE